MNFASWHDFWYMGGHYLYVWSAYGVGVAGIAVMLARPLLARRRFFAEQAQRLRREAAAAAGRDTATTDERRNASRPA